MAIERLSNEGSVTLGSSVIGSRGNRYRVTLDYVNASTANVRFRLGTLDVDGNPTRLNRSPRRGDPLYLRRIDATEVGAEGQALIGQIGNDQVVIPVYVGVGLRLTALIDVRRGNVNLGSLAAIAASVEAERAYGSMTVQTLGINGQQIAASLPLPSELNATTVQTAIQSLGSIKAVIYDKATRLAPRVIGIYNPLPDNSQRTVNDIVSQLAERPIPWNLSCPFSPVQPLLNNFLNQPDPPQRPAK